jgi:DNA-directed RNA polymerase specialized sigma24 family protein
VDADVEGEFRAFVLTRWPTLYRAAYLLTGQHEEAEDLLQAALIKTLGRWRRLEQPEAYVRKVMYFHP